MDDAGAGFASMRHVTELRPAYIKPDAQLIRGLVGDEARQELLRALFGFAVEIGATIIAEGVERAEDLDLLSRTGLPILAQGFAIAAPSAPFDSRWPRL